MSSRGCLVIECAQNPHHLISGIQSLIGIARMEEIGRGRRIQGITRLDRHSAQTAERQVAQFAHIQAGVCGVARFPVPGRRL